MGRGRIVLLNGPSSAGKTALAGAVAAGLPTPWLVLPVDLFHHVRSRPSSDLSPEEWRQVFRRTRSAYHHALVGAASAGCDVLGDHVLSEPWRLDELLGLSVGLDVLLVHVTCEERELARRERRRGDREIGTARSQLDTVFAHGDCDVEVDTTSTSSRACAALVLAALEAPPPERAFDRLRAR